MHHLAHGSIYSNQDLDLACPSVGLPSSVVEGDAGGKGSSQHGYLLRRHLTVLEPQAGEAHHRCQRCKALESHRGVFKVQKPQGGQVVQVAKAAVADLRPAQVQLLKALEAAQRGSTGVCQEEALREVEGPQVWHDLKNRAQGVVCDLHYPQAQAAQRREPTQVPDASKGNIVAEVHLQGLQILQVVEPLKPHLRHPTPRDEQPLHAVHVLHNLPNAVAHVVAANQIQGVHGCQAAQGGGGALVGDQVAVLQAQDMKARHAGQRLEPAVRYCRAVSKVQLRESLQVRQRLQAAVRHHLTTAQVEACEA
mmetsp:Transcript_2360/g.6857  ORF Transcript_2360/g.6857 Transcript_2360/m.6857 type:complete len:308 (+) Transcript_2360:224-1147(+)|eukprot:CAMPEP_0117671084 /NCGR_PEP_ID=MMETSP0804-20121206/13131_1 /TAXON_ID=1074897 /ORGANISM="Tetraselmis astigmatica, Strain CCMP880" /LENGTH=307 /DNA_ID=CAMNT_0005479493 /DNA_START=134 /DNA_END=1057 /DNA_ORIENTATION=+